MMINNTPPLFSKFSLSISTQPNVESSWKQPRFNHRYDNFQLPKPVLQNLQNLLQQLITLLQSLQLDTPSKPVPASTSTPSTTTEASTPTTSTTTPASTATTGTPPAGGLPPLTGTGGLPPLGMGGAGPASYPESLQPTFANLSYAPTSETQKLDVFLPKGDSPFPLVINIHGGGFKMGSKEMLDPAIAQSLLDKGIAVASINYRLSPEAKFPAALEDAKAAVRYLRANAESMNIDPDRFLAFGQSAGGNLASMLGTTGGLTEFDNPALGNAKVSSRVQGVVDWFGPTDFTQMDAQAQVQGIPATHNAADSPESMYLGSPVTEVPELAQRSNPINYITADDPAFLLQKGTKDTFIPVAQSTLLADALKAAGIPVEIDYIEGAGHGDMGTDTPLFSSPSNVKRVVDFMSQVLKVA